MIADQPAGQPGSGYLLGSAPDEQARLDLQAEYYRMATLDAMRWAGLAPGMRVLDIGSGTGAVAMAAASIVGPGGTVLGLDSSEAAVAQARANVARAGLTNVRFELADLDDWSVIGSPSAAGPKFDALTGRLISMYLPQPGRTIAALTQYLRPGGIVLLEEFAISSGYQTPETPVFRAALDRVLAAFRASGVPTDLGYGLGDVFAAAGLPVPTMTAATRWEDGPAAVAHALLAGATRPLAPVMVAHGIATEDEIGLDTLEDRLRSAAAGAGSGTRPPLLISAWARTPA